MKKQSFIWLAIAALLWSCSKHDQVMEQQSSQQPDKSVVVTGKQTLLLVFDGIRLQSHVWGFDTLANFSPSGLRGDQELYIADSVQRELQHRVGADIKVTLDPGVAASATRNQTIVITNYYNWYVPTPTAGGVAFMDSWYWDDRTPAFVFSSAFTYNVNGETEYSVGPIVSTILHEFGHTMGLAHSIDQDDWMYGTYVSGGPSNRLYGEPTKEVADSLTIYEKTTIAYGVSTYKINPSNPHASTSGYGGRTRPIPVE